MGFCQARDHGATMKLLSPLALFAACSLLATSLMAAEEQPGLTGCAAKKQAISEQIEQARAHGHEESHDEPDGAWAVPGLRWVDGWGRRRRRC